MSKRKKHKKKAVHKASPITKAPAAQPEVAATTATVEPVKAEPKQAMVVENSTTNYAFTDLVRIGILVSFFVALELALWLAFTHTDLGQTVYSLVKL